MAGFAHSNFDFPHLRSCLVGYIVHVKAIFTNKISFKRIFEIQANWRHFSNFWEEKFWALNKLNLVKFDLWPTHIQSAVSSLRRDRLQWMTWRWKGKHLDFLMIWHLIHRMMHVSRYCQLEKMSQYFWQVYIERKCQDK